MYKNFTKLIRGSVMPHLKLRGVTLYLLLALLLIALGASAQSTQIYSNGFANGTNITTNLTYGTITYNNEIQVLGVNGNPRGYQGYIVVNTGLTVYPGVSYQVSIKAKSADGSGKLEITKGATEAGARATSGNRITSAAYNVTNTAYAPFSASFTVTTQQALYIGFYIDGATNNSDLFLDDLIITQTCVTLPSPTVANATNTICGLGQVTLTSTVATGNTPTAGATNRWYTAATGGSVLATGASYSPTLNDYNSHTYYVGSYNTLTGCESSQRVAVTARAIQIPTATVTPQGPLSICQGTNVILAATEAPAGQTYTYQWRNGNDNISGATNRLFSASQTGSYSVVFTNEGKCASQPSNAVSVTVNPLPDAPNTVVSAERCGPGAVDLTVANATAGYSYRWYTTSTGGSPEATTTNATYSPKLTESTTYYVASVSGSCESSTRTAVTATIKPLPVASIDPEDPQCATPDGTTIFNLNGSALNGTYLQWDITQGASIASIDVDPNNPFTPTVRVTGTGTVKVRLTVSSNNNCGNDTEEVTLIVNSPASSDFTVVPDGRCGAGQVNLAVQNPQSGITYKWYTAGSAGTLLATGNTYSPTINSTTTYYVAAANAGCESPDRVAVTATVGAVPTVTTHNVDLCDETTADLTAASVTQGSTAGLIYSYWLDSEATQPVTNPAAAKPGTYYIKGTNQTSGCFAIQPVIVNKIQEIYIFNSDGPINICEGQTTTLYTGLGGVATSVKFYKYIDGIWTDVSVANAAHYVVSTSGDYRAEAVIRGCTKTSNVVTVNVTPKPTASASVVGDAVKCKEPTTTFSVSGTFSNGSAQWLSSNTNFVISNAVYNTATGVATATVQTTGTGTANITLRTTGTGGCGPVTSNAVTLQVNALPTVSITSPSAATPSYCVSDPAVTLAGNQVGGTFRILKGSTVVSSNATTFDPSQGAGTYTIEYSYTNGNGCSNTATKTVTVNPLPAKPTISNLASVYYTTDPTVTMQVTPATAIGGTFRMVNNLTGKVTTGASFTPCTLGVGNYTVTYTYSNGTCSNTSDPLTFTIKQSTYTVIVEASPFPTCRGQITTYQAVVYRNVTNVIYPYYANAAGEPINGPNGAKLGPQELPIANPAYPIPADAPQILKDNVFRYFQPIVVGGEKVDGSQFTYQWTKNQTNFPGADRDVFQNAGLSSLDYYAVLVSSNNQSTTCITPITNVISDRKYSSAPVNYEIALNVNKNPICKGDEITLTANLNSAFSFWTDINLTLYWMLDRGGNITQLGQTPYQSGTSVQFTTTGPSGGFQQGDKVYVEFSSAVDQYNSNKCSRGFVTNQITLNVNSISATATPKSPVICQNGSETFNVTTTATGPAAITYTWTVGTAQFTTNTPSLVIGPSVTATPGTYAVSVVVSNTCSTIPLSLGTLKVTPLPVQHSITGGGAYCASDNNGVSVGLTSSQTGVSYQLYNGTSPVGSPVAGTGSALNFPNQTAAGTYTVMATTVAAEGATAACPQPMTGTATVTINALPTVFNVTGGGDICENNIVALPVGISGSQTTVSYQLKRDGNNVGSPIAGTGSAIDFGTFTEPGKYTVEAISNTTPACPVTYTSNTTILLQQATDATGESLKVSWADNHTKWKVEALDVPERFTFGANPTYTWFRSEDGGISWTKVQPTAENPSIYMETAPSEGLLLKSEVRTTDGRCIRYILTNENVTPLPVEIMYLQANKQGNEVVLSWATAQEINNAGFEVQVSTDGFNYHKLGFVATRNGNATLKQEYVFTDKENGKHGTRYYRLKQLDMDGTFEYFGPRAVTFGEVADKIKVYPNPFYGEVTLDIAAEHAGEVLIQVHNSVGEQLLQRKVHVEKGVTSEKLVLGAGLPQGVYFITTQQDGQVSHFKLLKE